MTHTRSCAHLTSYLPTVYILYKSHITAYQVFHVQPEDDHCQVPKHVVVPYVVNTIYTPLPLNKVVLDKYIHFTLVSL
jgi:hypothetical protein